MNKNKKSVWTSILKKEPVQLFPQLYPQFIVKVWRSWLDKISFFSSNSMSASLCVCLFVCSLTPPKQLNLISRNFEG